MRFEDVKRIALYYKAIPGMLRLLRQEREELEEEYCGLGSTAADGVPHGRLVRQQHPLLRRDLRQPVSGSVLHRPQSRCFRRFPW